MTAPERRSQRGQVHSLMGNMAQLGRGGTRAVWELLEINAAVPKNSTVIWARQGL